MKFYSLFTSLYAVAVTFTPSPLRSCGTSADSLQLKSLEIQPYPILKGQNVTVIAGGNLSRPIIEGSTARIIVKAGFIPLYSNNINVCESAAKEGFPCPIVAGDQKISISQSLPDIVPAGRFDLRVVITNADKTQIACFQGTVQVVDPFAIEDGGDILDQDLA